MAKKRQSIRDINGILVPLAVIETKIIALYYSSPPEGYFSWSLRLLARKVVQLGIVQNISHESVRQILKTHHQNISLQNQRDFCHQQYKNILASEAERQYYKGFLDALNKSKLPPKFIELEDPIVKSDIRNV